MGTRALRSISNRPLSLNFRKTSIRLLPKQTSEFYPDAQWKDGFALKQAEKYVADREAVWVEEKDAVVVTPMNQVMGDVPKQDYYENENDGGGEN